jgi:hypothetical protein
LEDDGGVEEVFGGRWWARLIFLMEGDIGIGLSFSLVSSINETRSKSGEYLEDLQAENKGEEKKEKKKSCNLNSWNGLIL